MVHLLGIRHHGPGSSKSLLKALNEIQPDIILLEGTEEADKLLKYIGNDDLIAPIAILMYNPKDFSQAVYYPFTEFSPEWQSVLYANKNGIPVKHFDLPQSIRFAMNLDENSPQIEMFEEENSSDIDPIRRDPLGFLAKLAGYDDVERWWESTFEHYDGEAAALFRNINLIITAIREEHRPIRNDNGEEILREAFMRKTLREAIKNGYQNIVVVCGAWHTAALDLEAFPAKTDNALLKGLPKIKMQATWIPWTFERISKESGYGAGVIAPAWYQLLFLSESPVIEWMSLTAYLFRAEGLEAGTAQVIDAVRLAEALAAMRGLQLPGIDELFEASSTVFFNGNSEALDLIRKKLIIGDKMGEVPESISNLPLQQDIESQIKTLRLTKYKNNLEQDIKKDGLDLRNEFDRSQSKFLHRLNIIGINWGKEKAYSGREKTTMREYWILSWYPEFVLQMIEASMWGNDLETAASKLAMHKSAENSSLSEQAALLSMVIKAGLQQPMDFILRKLRESAAITKDVPLLMRTLPELVMIIRYGDVRKSDLGAIEALLKEMLPRICLALPNAAAFMDEDASEALFELIVANNRALNVLKNTDYSEIWHLALENLSSNISVNSLLQGAANRLLFDAGILDLDNVAVSMGLALSQANSVNYSSSWLRGFLYGSGLLLIHNPQLWNILDKWVEQLDDTVFQELLPVLRRSFSDFSKPERSKMLDIAKSGHVGTKLAFANNSFEKDKAIEIINSLNFIFN